MKDIESAKRVLYRRIFLLAYDIVSILLASFFALLVRFEFSYQSIDVRYIQVFQRYIPFQIVITIILFYIFRLYHSLWAFAGFAEIQNIISACFLSDVIQFIYLLITKQRLPYSYFVLYGIFIVILIMFGRLFYRFCRQFYYRRQSEKNCSNTMIVGAGEAGSILLKEIITSKFISMRVKCVIDDDPGKVGSYIHGVKIVGNRQNIPKMVKDYDIKKIIVAMPKVSKKEVKEIVEICQETGCEIKILPGIYQVVNGDVNVSKLRNIDIEDLLGREPVEVNLGRVAKTIHDKVVFISGGGGSIGSELCRQIARHAPKQLIIFDIYENNAYDIQQELKHDFPKLNLLVLIGSVRNAERLKNIFSTYHPDIVYHAAAHKHVPLMEDSPNEAIKNNVFGTLEIVKAADQYKVKKFVLISTDKAVNPTNVMGATKRICEMIIQTYNKHSDTEYVAVRFGNVLGSNGSVIPLFRRQIESGGPVTVTHPDIIRYFMTIPEAVALVLEAGTFAKGGEIFILDMGEQVKILDLAIKLIRLSGYIPYEDIQIEFTGLRPGEKLYEELLMKEEGMQDTGNKMIHIGKPIDMNEELFMKQLVELKEKVYEEKPKIREELQKIVNTYTPTGN